MLAEFRPIQLDQPMPMPILLGPHLLEHLGRGRIIFFHRVGEVGVNPGIFLFQRDGQRKQFLWAKALERSHAGTF